MEIRRQINYTSFFIFPNLWSLWSGVITERKGYRRFFSKCVFNNSVLLGQIYTNPNEQKLIRLKPDVVSKRTNTYSSHNPIHYRKTDASVCFPSDWSWDDDSEELKYIHESEWIAHVWLGCKWLDSSMKTSSSLSINPYLHDYSQCIINLKMFRSPNHCLEKPRAVGDGWHGLVHQRVNLDEVQRFIWKLVGHFEFLTRGSSCADARPEDDNSEHQSTSWRLNNHHTSVSTPSETRTTQEKVIMNRWISSKDESIFKWNKIRFMDLKPLLMMNGKHGTFSHAEETELHWNTVGVVALINTWPRFTQTHNFMLISAGDTPAFMT